MPSTRSTSEADAGLEAMLQGEAPEERERVIRAWHALLRGDPESMPVQFALVTRGMAKILAGTVDAARNTLSDAAAARAEVDQARKGFALETDRRLAELGRLMEAGKNLPAALDAAVARAREAAADLPGQRPRRFGAAQVLSLIAFAAFAFWMGGEWRQRQEQRTVGQLLDRWEKGDGDAYRELIGRIGRYREFHQTAGEGPKP